MMARSFGLIFASAILTLLSGAYGKTESTTFKIVPGQDGKVDVALDTPPIASSTCAFEWAANGATTEMWSATVTGDQSSGDLECVIERAGGGRTYLMFTSFKTTLGTAPIIDAAVHGNGELVQHVVEPVPDTDDGECVKNHHEWSGGEIRSIVLKSGVSY